MDVHGEVVDERFLGREDDGRVVPMCIEGYRVGGGIIVVVEVRERRRSVDLVEEILDIHIFPSRMPNVVRFYFTIFIYSLPSN